MSKSMCKNCTYVVGSKFLSLKPLSRGRGEPYKKLPSPSLVSLQNLVVLHRVSIKMRQLWKTVVSTSTNTVSERKGNSKILPTPVCLAPHWGCFPSNFVTAFGFRKLECGPIRWQRWTDRLRQKSRINIARQYADGRTQRRCRSIT